MKADRKTFCNILSSTSVFGVLEADSSGSGFQMARHHLMDLIITDVLSRGKMDQPSCERSGSIDRESRRGQMLPR